MDFLSALIVESESKRGFFKGAESHSQTLYFGGGTPSLIDPQELGKIARTVCIHHGFNPPESLDEFTVEVNPDDASLTYLKSLYSNGVRRLSMGIQSFNENHLRWMNRRHSAAAAVKAFYNAREAGFDNISIDLIFGFEGMSTEEWRFNLLKATELYPEHISSYQMSIEPRTKLGKEYAKGSYTPPEDSTSYNQYSLLQKTLEEAGYIQYEVSSFALRGREALHNSRYWDRTPYLGLGPAAHSFDGERRFGNRSSLTAYIKRFSAEGIAEASQPGYRERYISSERLSSKDVFNETLMLSLRRVAGLNLRHIEGLVNQNEFSRFMVRVDRMLLSGDLELSGENIKIPPGRLFLSDGIIRDLFC